MNISDKTLLIVISLLVFIAITSTAYVFLIRQDYDIIIETPCDTAQTTCFSRDCSGDECPHNGLEQYRIFSVHADDFSACADTACLRECTSGVIPCIEIMCGESEDDVCTAPSDPNEQ